MFSQLEKTRLVKKLKAARDRRRATGARVEGRRSCLQRLRDAKAIDAVTNLEAAVGLAKRLRRASPVTGKRMSLRKISAELAKAGHLNEQGRPYNPKSVLALINGPRPKSDETRGVTTCGALEGPLRTRGSPLVTPRQCQSTRTRTVATMFRVPHNRRSPESGLDFGDDRQVVRDRACGGIETAAEQGGSWPAIDTIKLQ